MGFMITGLNGYICDSCAQQAYEIVQEASRSVHSSGDLDWSELPKPKEIKEFLDQYVIGLLKFPLNLLELWLLLDKLQVKELLPKP